MDAGIIIGIVSLYLTFLGVVYARKQYRLSKKVEPIKEFAPTVCIRKTRIDYNAKINVIICLDKEVDKTGKLVIFNFPISLLNEETKTMKDITLVFRFPKESLIDFHQGEPPILQSGPFSTMRSKRKVAVDEKGRHCISYMFNKTDPGVQLQLMEPLLILTSTYEVPTTITLPNGDIATTNVKLTVAYPFELIVFGKDIKARVYKFSLHVVEGGQSKARSYFTKLNSGDEEGTVKVSVLEDYYILEPTYALENNYYLGELIDKNAIRKIEYNNKRYSAFVPLRGSLQKLKKEGLDPD